MWAICNYPSFEHTEHPSHSSPTGTMKPMAVMRVIGGFMRCLLRHPPLKWSIMRQTRDKHSQGKLVAAGRHFCNVQFYAELKKHLSFQ